ncbi:glycoside hydrolase family 127 protein [Arthrobacter sp. G.S.26]|uniref:glycoside hydrolase family 127 protein n=1 Tax=Micrococcaceae TaxID=1268 RepID=UPI002554066B|nr:beta-L-arabinofuranosidase domain-containing protein [Pseudarthrobacter sp. MEB009]
MTLETNTNPKPRQEPPLDNTVLDTTLTRYDPRPVCPATTLLYPLGLSETRLRSTGFWGERSRINATNTLDHCLGWLERSGWLPNFDRAAAGTLPAGRQGREFADSEIYKLLEAYCWESATHPSNNLERTITAITGRLAAAQEEDGYLNTNFGRPGQSSRYSDLEWGHELYNYGHLLQAAVARLRTHGEDELVGIARRVADHICHTFGPEGIQSVCGHPEIELGLMEFSRATGEERYRDQARLFIDRRGHGVLDDIEWGRSYYQDDMPVRESTVLRGHAVRALYLAAAVVDLAVDTADQELLSIIETQWENTVAKRTYITGGMGSHHQDEAFGDDYVLPSDRAYCESCAGVASVMLSWRLLLATGNARYADLIERTLFNIVATATAEDGKTFFYSNTLHRRNPGTTTGPEEQSKRADSSQRAAWFDVACCPNNIARTLASLGTYLATSDEEGIQIHQFANTDIATDLPGERRIRLSVNTQYPHDGNIAVTVDETPTGPWTLSIRVPGWAENATIDINGKQQPAAPGYNKITRTFASGDLIHLRLPMTPRMSAGDDRIDAIKGSVAIECGPRVYCLESADLPLGRHVDDFIIDPHTALDLDGERINIQGWLEKSNPAPWPFHPAGQPSQRTVEPVATSLVPYHHWGNNGPVTMRVWLKAPIN